MRPELCDPVRRHRELGRQYDAVVQADMIVIQGQGKTVQRLCNDSQVVGCRVFGFQRQGPEQGRNGMRGRVNALCHGQAVRVDSRRDIGCRCLARRRRPETCADGSAQIEIVSKTVTGRQLPGCDIAKVAEMIETRLGVEQPFMGHIHFQVDVAGIVVPAQRTGKRR